MRTLCGRFVFVFVVGFGCHNLVHPPPPAPALSLEAAVCGGGAVNNQTFCPAGLYKESDEVGCRPCVSGTYSEKRAYGNHSCLGCDPGRAKSLVMLVFVLTGFG